jgi:hypothetical protein
VATVHTAIDVDPRSCFLLASGTRFAPAPARRLALSLQAGTVFGQVDARAKELAVELAPELGGAVVRTSGCHFYSAGDPCGWLAHRGELAEWPESIRVHVFAGTLELDLGAQKLALRGGDSAIVAGGISAGPTSRLEARAAELRLAIGAETLARRSRYRRLSEQYRRRLGELRAVGERQELAYLPERILLVAELLRDHAATLARIETKHPDTLELDAVQAELGDLRRLRARAGEALERLVARIGTAG